MRDQEVVQVVAEALAATALRSAECDPMGGTNWRYYSLPLEARAQHVRRAEDIVDRLVQEGFHVGRSEDRENSTTF